jgi:hypothetical protein
MGFTALRQMANAVGLPYETDPDPDADIELTFEEFEAGVQRMVDTGFEIERPAAEAWPHFRGWRANYESIAYRLAYKTDAVPALWSGPRRWEHVPLAPVRPANRRPAGTEDPMQTKRAAPAGPAGT